MKLFEYGKICTNMQFNTLVVRCNVMILMLLFIESGKLRNASKIYSNK